MDGNGKHQNSLQQSSSRLNNLQNCTPDTETCDRCGWVDTTKRYHQNISTELLVAGVVDCYLVAVLGTTVNLIAIWCVGSCTKTRLPVKVLLLSVFLPTLLICLLVQPAWAQLILAKVLCNPDYISRSFKVTTALVYSILAHMELVAITVMAAFRAVAVWSKRRHEAGMRTVVGLLAANLVYCTLTGVGLLGSLMFKWVKEPRVRRIVSILYFLTNKTLPILVTGACYASCMIGLRKNKHRLQACQQQHQQGRSVPAGGVANQATRAIFAVFVSNLVFGLPHAIFHLIGTFSDVAFVVVHMSFFTHFVLDPLVFVWYNRGHRNRVTERARWMLRYLCFSNSIRVSLSRKISALLHLHSSSISFTHSTSFTSSTVQPISFIEQCEKEKDKPQ